MPLILITGFACSGKTHRAQQLAAEFSARISSDPSSSRLTVRHLQSHHASSDFETGLNTGIAQRQTDLRDQIYNSAKEEKTARAEEFSAIKRALSKEVIVIADGLNYIKGYRYQIWCEAKAAGTRCCVVHVAAREDECKAWNNERLRSAGRGDEVEDAEQKHEPTHGSNGPSEMLPESHTAIYGDRVVPPTSRSRSSSMDGGASDDDVHERPQAEDTMTLKSLYIRDRPNRAQYEEKEDNPTTTNPTRNQPTSLPAAQESPTASATPPTSSTSHPYAPATLTSLLMRYEPPSPFSRWDTPLFTVPTSDPHPPYPQIWDALFPPPTTHRSKKALSQLPQHQQQTDNPINLPPSSPAPSAASSAAAAASVKPHASTVLPTASPASALQTLEGTTQLVATSLLAAYRASALFSAENFPDGSHDGGTLTFSVEELECEVWIPAGLAVSQPVLQRLRRKYTGLQRGGIAHGMGTGVGGGRRAVVEGFVEFLGREWGAGEDG